MKLKILLIPFLSLLILSSCQKTAQTNHQPEAAPVKGLNDVKPFIIITVHNTGDRGFEDIKLEGEIEPKPLITLFKISIKGILA